MVMPMLLHSLRREDVFVIFVILNDAVIFGEVWVAKIKLKSPLFTDSVSAIFTDSNEATHIHAAEPSAVPVFGHVQVVGLGMAQSLSQ